MQIREAYGDDIGAIAEMWLDLVEHHRAYNAQFPQPTPNGEMQYAHLVHTYIGRNDGVTFVAVAGDGEPIGYIFGTLVTLTPPMFVAERGGHIMDLFVRPAARRGGVGRRLYRALAGWFWAQGVRTVEWDVSVENKPGHAFWRSVGGGDLMLRMRAKLDNEGLS